MADVPSIGFFGEAISACREGCLDGPLIERFDQVLLVGDLSSFAILSVLVSCVLIKYKNHQRLKRKTIRGIKVE